MIFSVPYTLQYMRLTKAESDYNKSQEIIEFENEIIERYQDILIDEKCRNEINRKYKPEFDYQIIEKSLFDIKRLWGSWPKPFDFISCELIVTIERINDGEGCFSEFIFPLKEDLY